MADPNGAWLQAHFVTALDNFQLDIELALPKTGVTALFGKSGSGKTTLLRCIAGLDRAQQGELLVGYNCWQRANHFVRPHQRAIGYVFQEPSLLPHLNVEKNLRFGLTAASDTPEITWDSVVELLELSTLLTRSPSKLSGGERQRVAIGRALLSQPQLLLMDEPLSALDQEGKQQILPYLKQLTKELALPTLFVSHSLDEVCQLADRMIYIEAGSVVEQGAITDVVARLPARLESTEVSSVIESRLIGQDPGYGLSYLDFEGNRISVNFRQAEIGERVRVRIPANDVAIALEPVDSSSMLNTFPATLTDFTLLEDGARVLLKLKCGAHTVLSKITKKSFDLMGLRKGSEVYAQVKTVSLFE